MVHNRIHQYIITHFISVSFGLLTITGCQTFPTTSIDIPQGTSSKLGVRQEQYNRAIDKYSYNKDNSDNEDNNRIHIAIDTTQKNLSLQPTPLRKDNQSLQLPTTPLQEDNQSLQLPSTQGRRVALVIGNGYYQHANLPKLSNPTNDAEDISVVLRNFGFEVIERENQTLEAMNKSIAEFGSRIGGSDAALFYFAGHGIQVKNQNYLMPVNAVIESEAVVPYQGVNVNQILDEMDSAKSSVNIVMLDACRNNPISGRFRSGSSSGLASPGSTPKGTVIVYATDPGNTAADGDGRNGLFTAGLLTAFRGKDLSLDEVLTVASEEVERISKQAQTPYVNGPKTLQKKFHFR